VSNERRKQLQAKFQLSARERLARLNRSLPALFNRPLQAELTAEVLRDLHTLKGDAKVVGFPEVSSTAHRLEDLLAWAKARAFRLSAAEVDLTLEGVDLVSARVDGTEGEAVDARWARFEQACSALLGGEAAAVAAPSPARPVTQAPEQAAAAPPTAPEESYVRIRTALVGHMTSLTGDLLLRQGQMDKLIADLGRLQRAWRTAVEQYAEAPMDPRSKRRGRPAVAPQAAAHLAALGKELSTTVALARQEAFENHLELKNLHERVREMRLRQVGDVFERIPSAAREMARGLGKRVRVELTGIEVAVDQQVLDELEEPLLHLVRNTLDHGLESPEERRTAGKPEEGRLRLSARQLRNFVEVVVEDDGRGMDPVRLREAAVRKGLLSQAAVDALTDAAAVELIFLAGLTTRVEVTDLSGRGVGLDVVKKRVERLGGVVGVHSQPGHGVRFTMTVPVSVALSRALLFRSGDGLYAVPSTAVVEVLRVGPESIESAAGGRAVRLPSGLVPLHDVPTLLGEGPGREVGSTTTLIVVRREEEMVALAVEQLLGERELVQQPLNPFVSALRMISGSSVIDGGRLVLVMSVPELLREAGRRRGAVESTPEPVRARRLRVLIVDDSEVIRDLMVALAAKLGWDVEEAVDGQDALEKVERQRPDVVITDLDMPILDGIGFIERYRARHGAQTPVVVLSTRGSSEDKQRAMAAGANAYLVKSSFQESEFTSILKVLAGQA
jgi:two-component system chemotaxis sensor kinase CheA